MPIPTLTIDDAPNGLPRQPVSLRLACLVTGLTCADFRYLLAAIQEGGWPYLTAYEYRPGDEPREVDPGHYRSILRDAPNNQPSADFLEQLPADHFVWSDELAGAFSNFVTDCPGREDAADLGYGLVWHPALLDMDALIAACVDLTPWPLLPTPRPRRSRAANSASRTPPPAMSASVRPPRLSKRIIPASRRPGSLKDSRAKASSKA